MITDSGLGGLSVCAGIERVLTAGKAGSEIELLYVNATPHDRIGYNSLKTQAERIELFDQFLHAAYNRYTPDEIAIACNTLSVIYDETSFASQAPIPVKGIVNAGVSLCNEQLHTSPDFGLIIFATETTTEAGTYPRLIDAAQSRIVAQACPELAHAISNDFTGATSRKLLEDYISEAIGQLTPGLHSVFAFLGCTHYGYQAQLFKEMLIERGFQTTILNPNDRLVSQLTSGVAEHCQIAEHQPRIRFISRYEVPQVEIDSMLYYLKESAPLTLAALHNQIVVPDLFATP